MADDAVHGLDFADYGSRVSKFSTLQPCPGNFGQAGFQSDAGENRNNIPRRHDDTRHCVSLSSLVVVDRCRDHFGQSLRGGGTVGSHVGQILHGLCGLDQKLPCGELREKNEEPSILSPTFGKCMEMP